MFSILANLPIQNTAPIPYISPSPSTLALVLLGLGQRVTTAGTIQCLELHYSLPNCPTVSVFPSDHSLHARGRMPNATASLMSCSGFAGSSPAVCLPCIPECPH